MRWKDYKGRSTRLEFWSWTGFFLLVSLLSPLLVVFLEINSPLLGMILRYWWYVLVPAQIAVSVRRMHDVGKPGWYFLIPFYNLYLYLQPSVEAGKLPLSKILQHVALAFIPLSLVNILTGSNDVLGSFIGAILWTLVFVLIKRYNTKKFSLKLARKDSNGTS